MYDLLMTLISIFGKDFEEAKKALKSKILLSVVLACVFVGERAVAHVSNGFMFARSWVEVTLQEDVWQPSLIEKRFLNSKAQDFEQYIASDRTYWLSSGLVSSPWPLAQDIMADPIGALEDRDEILQLYKAQTLPGCVCWAETGSRQHTAASAWVTTALSVLGGDQRDSALDDLLSKQTLSGAWMMFPESTNDPRTGSTYATTMALMAIAAHRDKGHLTGERKKAADRATFKASRWLIRNYNFAEKSWMDYPNAKEGRPQALGLTAQTLWTLHQVSPAGQLARIDRNFIERDDLDPKIKDFDMSDVPIYFAGNSMDYDNTRYARQPWTLLAMQAGYANYSRQQRVKMRLTISKSLNESAWEEREAEREYMVLELLFAYRALTGDLWGKTS